MVKLQNASNRLKNRQLIKKLMFSVPFLHLFLQINIFCSTSTGSDFSHRERRAGDRQDPPRRHDRPARPAPRGRHHQGGEREGGGERPQGAAGDAEGGQRQRGAEDPPQLPGASHSETGEEPEPLHALIRLKGYWRFHQ